MNVRMLSLYDILLEIYSSQNYIVWGEDLRGLQPAVAVLAIWYCFCSFFSEFINSTTKVWYHKSIYESLLKYL